MNDKIVRHQCLDHTDVQLDVLLRIDLGSWVISRN